MMEALERPAVHVRSPRVAEWQRVRALRLEMLRDMPGAYAVTLTQALMEGPLYWRERAQPSLDGRTMPVIAETTNGAWVGTAAAVQLTSDLPELVGVYVQPAWRGRTYDVLGRLLVPLEAWAAARGGLRLLVQEANVRAQRAYIHRGYTFTGYSEAHLLPPHGLDLEMAKTLSGT